MKKDAGVDFKPGCSCWTLALEPADDCWVHGYPDRRQCPFCGQFRGYTTACKRCGCTYGLLKRFLYLCSQLTCKHFRDEFAIAASEKILGYVPCPACGCSAEENGLNGGRLLGRVKPTYNVAGNYEILGEV